MVRGLGGTVFETGDRETDRLLESARERMVRPKIEDRRDALEKLWDAFERLKTFGAGSRQATADGENALPRGRQASSHIELTGRGRRVAPGCFSVP